MFTRHFSPETKSVVITGIVQIEKVTVTVDDGRKEYALSKKDIENGLRVQADEDTLARLLSITARLRITLGDAIHIVSVFVFHLLPL